MPYEFDSMSSNELYDERAAYYHIKMRKGWFRGLDVFTERMSHYDRVLVAKKSVRMELNAGNMIYTMMQRLETGVDWRRQALLISSYRDLVYKLSYVSCMCREKDSAYIHMDGQKGDIMWSLAFITQVFPDSPLECWEVPSESDVYNGAIEERFDVQNGVYVGDDKEKARKFGELLPDIWAGTEHLEVAQVVVPEYNVMHAPVSGDAIVIPDGRTAQYMRMDERFQAAEQYGPKIDSMIRHNISASLIKDFYDMLWRQTSLDYDVYHMRYVALMSKVHELEHMLGGLEITCYDVLPIGERGLPYAADDTVNRTNDLDAGSLQYLIEKIENNNGRLSEREAKRMTQDASRSVIGRISGYDLEFRSYRATGTEEPICANIRVDKCTALYEDFVVLDTYGLLKCPMNVYRRLCNDPDNSIYNMTSFERERLRLFGRGYADFLSFRIETTPDKQKRRQYIKAMNMLKGRYLDRFSAQSQQNRPGNRN